MWRQWCTIQITGGNGHSSLKNVQFLNFLAFSWFESLLMCNFFKKSKISYNSFKLRSVEINLFSPPLPSKLSFSYCESASPPEILPSFPFFFSTLLPPFFIFSHSFMVAITFSVSCLCASTELSSEKTELKKILSC